MNINKGQQVKLFLQNNISVEGQVQFWSDKEVILKTKTNSLFTIFNIQQNVIMCEMLSAHPEKPKPSLDILQKEFDKVSQKPHNDLKMKQLVELRKDLKQAEEELVKNKLRNHEISGNLNLTSYQNPFLK